MASYFDRFKAALPPKYELVREIGTGGMGIVFLARDGALDRHVAIKLLRPEIATADAKEHFIAEAQLIAKIAHPNVVPVHDVGESDGFAYYVMDYVQGETLQQRLARQPMTKHEALKFGRDLLDALSAVHALGVIHRDIKPSNIFLRDRIALLADFGIASPSEERHDAPRTESSPVGTPGYMPPEQVYGTELSQRTDLYAAAMVIYEAYTTRRWADTIPAGNPDWSRVPWLVRRVLRRALSWNADDRWKDAREFRHRLWTTRVRKYQMRTGLVALGGIIAVAIAMRGGPIPTDLTIVIPTDLAIMPASADSLSDVMVSYVALNMRVDYSRYGADENLGTPLADRLSQLGARAMVQVAVTSDGDSLRVHVTVLTEDNTTDFEVAGV
ncbi:MAG: serine/threonine-protein kinase, partial [Gemmatimonadales bacterium]